MAVTIQATFTKDTKEYDGLGACSAELVADPLTPRVVVGTVQVTNIDVDVLNGGMKTPKVRVVSMEMLTGDDAVHALKMRDAAYHERTGQVAPPATLFDDGVPLDRGDEEPGQDWLGGDRYDRPTDGPEPDAKAKRVRK